MSNQTLYSETWISGATRWDWRAESGDWRFLSVDWPEAWDTGGTVVLDVDWDDNPYTDIDLLWLSEMPHGYSEDDPEAYGDNTFYIESRSTNNYAGGGSHDWGTYTGTSREIFAVPAKRGMHQFVFHTALHGVQTNDNPLNVSVGYVAAEESGFERVVTDWSQGSGVDAVHIVSTVPLSVDSVTAQGWSQPVHFDNETAYQDVSNDKMTSSWWHNVTVQNSTELNIEMNAHDDADLDLFLFRDSNGDGSFSSGEEIARSWTSSSAEEIRIVDPEDGNYSIAVHGYSVPGDMVQFWIEIEVVGGDELVITDQQSLTSPEIDTIWPNGSETLAGLVPASAFQVNLSFDRPEYAGAWSGFIDITLEGQISFRMPYTYELVELDPEVSFVVPSNLTQTNVSVPIRLHALDTGIGFRLDDLNWDPVSQSTTIPEADLVEALDTTGSHHNLTAIWNSGNHFAMPENLSLREVWINSTLPEVEQWHDYIATLADISNNTAESFLSIAYDITAPHLAVSNIPWITNQEYLTYTIQTEPDATVTHSGVPVELDENGHAEVTVQLTPAGVRGSATSPFYYVHGSSVFELEVGDHAGNSVVRDFIVVYDPDTPEAQLIDIVDQAGYHYSSEQITTPVNMSEGLLYISTPSDVRDWCLRVESAISNHSIEQCQYGNLIPPVVLDDTSGWNISTLEYGINVSALPDGQHTISLELVDWANNTFVGQWPLVLDRTTPNVEWEISPGTNSSFFDHRQGLSWLSSEEAHIRFTIDGILISERTGILGGALFELNHTGIHEVCMEATDATGVQENSNRFSDCRTISLDPSIYHTQVISNWDGGLVSVDQVQATLQRGPNQEIWWSRSGSPGSNLIEPGADIVILTFNLLEGENRFVIEINALDHTDEYVLTIVKDTMSPELSFTEVENYTTPLETIRVVSGICEAGAMLMLWSEIDSKQLLCDSSGEFEIHIEIPVSPGEHVIEGLSVDAANNQRNYSIEVLKQEWLDWAIEDARNSGPMLWWFSLAALLLIMGVSVTRSVIRRRRARIDRIERQGPDLDEIMSEIEDSVFSDSE